MAYSCMHTSFTIHHVTLVMILDQSHRHNVVLLYFDIVAYDIKVSELVRNKPPKIVKFDIL